MEDNNNSEEETIVFSNKVLNFTEHQFFSEAQVETLKNLGLNFQPVEYEGIPKYLGISSEQANYYIGASWLTKERAVVVTPKIIDKDNPYKKTDFIEMYLRALKFSPSSEYFSKFYGIDFEQPVIECNSLNEQLTPLLIVHFISCLRKAIGHGLKKDYVLREENLQSKVRGRIMMQKNLQKNIFSKRYDRTYCKYQEYTVDIPINRLLKKALIFSSKYLNQLVSFQYHISLSELISDINKLKSSFYLVSEDIEVHEIKTLKKNKLFKDYNEAFRLAKLILQRFDYSINNAGIENKTVPPFWIDMSRLFEVYVYSKLEEAYPGQIKFQVPGKFKSVADFVKVDEHIILDAKYKPRYKNSNSQILADIREMSGYARDYKIRKQMGLRKDDAAIVPCVIIYPEYIPVESEEDMSEEEKEEVLSQEEDTVLDFECKSIRDIIHNHQIPGFKEFYKISINLPYYEVPTGEK